MVTRRTNAPVYEGDFPVRMSRAKVLSVDKVKWVATVQPEDGGLPIEGVPIEPMQVGGKEGSGSYSMPESGGLVWLFRPSTDATPVIMGGATAPKQTDEGDDNEDPNDRRTNRPVLNEGDVALAVSDQGHLIMRKGGMLEAGAGPDCKTIYIPLTNVIRNFSQGWEKITSGGNMSMLPRAQDQVYGGEDPNVATCSSEVVTADSTPTETNTPVEFQLKVKEFAENEDEFAVDIRMGRIQDEDDEKLVGGDLGACVYRFNINDRHTVWIDRTGNFQTKTAGVVKEEYLSYVERTYNSKFRQQILGLMDSEMQNRSLWVKSNDLQVVGRDRAVDIAGHLKERVAKSVTRTGGKLTEDYKGIKRTVRGGVVESVHGTQEQYVGSNRNTQVAGDDNTTVSRNKAVTVGKAEANPNPLDVSYQIYIYNGVFAVHDAAGKIVFSTGTPLQDTALAKVTLKPSGSVELTAGLAGVSLEVNLTGMKLKTPGGEISLDNLGTVELGQGPVRGAVLTTLTMPACYVTGVPTIGCSAVQAGGIPQPALPPISVPSTFVPDETPLMALDADVLASLVFADHLARYPQTINAVRENPDTGVPPHVPVEAFIQALCNAFVGALLLMEIRDLGAGNLPSPGAAIPVPFSFPGRSVAVTTFLTLSGWLGGDSAGVAQVFVGSILNRASDIGLLQMSSNTKMGAGAGVVSPATNPHLQVAFADEMSGLIEPAFQATGKFGRGDVPTNPINPDLRDQLDNYCQALAVGVASIVASVAYTGGSGGAAVTGIINKGAII